MALWNSTENNKTYINLKLVSVPGPCEKQDSPKFYVLWDDFQLTDKSYTKIKWKLTWIKSTFTPKKGKMWDIYWFKAFLEDGDEIYVIESTITNASKDILNNLLTSKDKVVEVSVYLNKNWYPTWSIKLEDWNFAPWFMDFKSITPQGLTDGINNTFVKKEENSWELNIWDIPF